MSRNIKPVKEQSRRSLFKSLAAGGGALITAKSLPGAWVKPVVDAVLLPAHAATSSMYLPSAGAAAIVLTRNETGRRFAGLLDELVPTAEAIINDTIIYVCVEPSVDGAKADVTVYEGILPCSPTSAPSVARHTITGVDVPSTGNVLINQGDLCALGGIEDLLERLGIVKSAFADGVITVDITSVENGAKGKVHVGSDKYVFDVQPGPCSPPTCCER